MASKMTCDPCSRLDKSTISTKYCTDCEEYLCVECATFHSAMKALANHHLTDATLYTDKTFNIDKTCSEHENMTLEFYCSDHDCVCCRSCIAGTHRTCGKIFPLEVAAKGVKSSTLYDDLNKDVTELLKTLHLLDNETIQNKSKINQRKKEVIQSIAKTKAEYIKHLDDLERKLNSEVETLEKSLIKRAEKDISEVVMRRQSVKGISEKLDFLTKHGSNSQLFLLLNQIKVDITKEAQHVQDLLPNLKSRTIVFNPSNLISVMDSLGSIKTQISPCQISFSSPKLVQAQMLEQSKQEPTHFELVKKFEVPGRGRITSIAVTNGNRLILCLENDNKLSAWNEMGQHLNDCLLGGRVWGVSIVLGTDQAVVTLTDLNSVQFVNLSTMTPDRIVKVPVSCFGVTIAGDKILIGTFGGIYVTSIEGKYIKTLNVGSRNILSIFLGKDDMIYCCDTDGDNTVHCIKMDGTPLFSYGSKDLDKPVDISIGPKGYLYITGYWSSNIHRLTPDGQLIDVILQQKNGLNEPMAITFNKTYTKMFISNTWNKQSILVFNCI